MCWHDWSKWSIPTDAYSSKQQHSICNKCGAIKSRELPYDDSTPAAVVYGKFKSWFTENHDEIPKV